MKKTIKLLLPLACASLLLACVKDKEESIYIAAIDSSVIIKAPKNWNKDISCVTPHIHYISNNISSIDTINEYTIFVRKDGIYFGLKIKKDTIIKSVDLHYKVNAR